MSQPLQAFKLASPEQFLREKQVQIVDQLALPHVIKYDTVSTVQGAFDAIKSMRIRGAPAIGSLAALGIAAELLAFVDGKTTPYFTPETSSSLVDSSSSQNATPRSSAPLPSPLYDSILKASAFLLTSRPTAVNLKEALDRIEATALAHQNDAPADLAHAVIDTAVTVWSEDYSRNVAIGTNGAKWILSHLEASGRIAPGGKVVVLTVCNTGSLATSGHGTALGIIASLHELGRLEHAYFAQTGPYQQGARLTSLELLSLGIPSTMICDTAIGALIAEKRVDAFLAGADRVAANGDTANKVSTFQIATLAAHPHPFSPNAPVPVIVAAPVTTLDLSMATGRSIIIEQRPRHEAITLSGRTLDAENLEKLKNRQELSSNVDISTILFTPPNIEAWNPAFDVTPASLITAIATEVGVAEKKQGQVDFDLVSFVTENKPSEKKQA